MIKILSLYKCYTAFQMKLTIENGHDIYLDDEDVIEMYVKLRVSIVSSVKIYRYICISVYK